METNDRVLQTITDETKTSLSTMKIVTPSVYASIFTQFSKEYNGVLEDDTQLSSEILNQECATFTKLQRETTNNVNALSLSTQKAITAMHDKDESALNQVLQETKLLKDEIEALKSVIYKDELTYIYNRKWLNDNIINSETNKFLTNGVLAMVDLNYFKIINDTFGHVIGDKVLIIIANELKKSTYDVVRYGGDEFIIIFPENINEKEAFKILDDIREDVLKKKRKAKDSVFRVSFSIGVSSFTTKDELNETLEIADKYMYDDKLSIKKRVTGIDV